MIRTGFALALIAALGSCGRAERHPVETGGLCGVPDVIGEMIGQIEGSVAGCGVENAARITSVSGIALTQAATVDCPTVRALKTWIDTGAKSAIGTRGGGIASIKVAAHYVCRTRNHKAGAKISEHGKGKAIDISAIRLNDGSEITVLDGWRGSDGRALRKMHSAACGPFGTVLGPESDRYHQDHFHFDTASYRGGPYCK